MFLKNSRYYGLAIVIGKDRSGREIVAVKLRRLPTSDGHPTTVLSHDRLDLMSDGLYRDATRYWHIADANTELEAQDLTRPAGRVIFVPKA